MGCGRRKIHGLIESTILEYGWRDRGNTPKSSVRLVPGPRFETASWIWKRSTNYSTMLFRIKVMVLVCLACSCIFSFLYYGLNVTCFLLFQYGWYWGPISGEAAEKILSNEPDGSFIVRDSSDDHYIFSLTFKLNGCIRHVRIEHDQG